jgi:uncharacterized protein (TIGR02001 family)
VTHFKASLIALAVGAGLAPTAQAQLSANIGAVSNYVWRGVTQTDDGPAIQGGVDYAHDSGVFLGTWVSNVDFGGPDDPQYELDLYGGYAGTVGDFGYKAGLYYYAYPQTEDANFLELGLSGTYKFLTVGLNYTLDGQNENDNAYFVEGDIYYYLSATFDLGNDFGITGTVGYYDFDEGKYEDDDGDLQDGDYAHALISLTKAAGDFGTFSLNFSFAEDDANFGDDDPKVYVAWLKTF